MRIPALALAQRALLLDARGHAPYVLRCLLAAFMLLALWMVVQWNWWRGAPGLYLFEWLVYGNFCFVSLFGISSFAAVITEEKENMTLGLLKMAGFSGPSILVGKSVGLLLSMVLLLLVQVPFALLAITLGGVSQHQVFCAWLLLFAHGLFVYALALVMSVAAPRSGMAARLTGLLLLAYYLLPPAGMWLDQPGVVAAGGQLFRVSHWLAENSVLLGLIATTSTGFSAPLFATAVTFTLAMAAVLFVLAGLLFAPCTRSEVAAAPTRGFFGDWLRRGSRAISRPIGHPVMWKDFHFLSGGPTGLTLRFVAYGLLLLGVWLVLGSGRRGPDSREFGQITMWIMFFATVLDLGIQAGRMFREEIKWRTLPTLILLPMPLSSWAYAKAAACAVIAIPPACYFIFGVVLAPEWSGRMMRDVLSHGGGWYFLTQVVVGLHLTVFLSLRLRRGALPLAILILVIGNVMMVLMLASGGPGGLDACLGMMAAGLLGLSLAMHPAIGRMVTEKAAE